MVYVIVLLLMVAFVTGFYDVLFVELVFEINTLSTPYYQLGIFFYSEECDENSTVVIDKLIIGLLFINVNILFYKKNI